MPSTSAKQKKFMAAAAHSPRFAHKAGVPTSVAREFHEADKKLDHHKHGRDDGELGKKYKEIFEG